MEPHPKQAAALLLGDVSHLDEMIHAAERFGALQWHCWRWWDCADLAEHARAIREAIGRADAIAVWLPVGPFVARLLDTCPVDPEQGVWAIGQPGGADAYERDFARIFPTADALLDEMLEIYARHAQAATTPADADECPPVIFGDDALAPAGAGVAQDVQRPVEGPSTQE